MVPPLLACEANVPLRSEPLFNSFSDVRMVWRLGGVLEASISVGGTISKEVDGE